MSRRNRISILVCAFALTFALGVTVTGAPKWANLLFAGRQGGSASDWSVPGTNNYNSVARVQVGVVQGEVSTDGAWPTHITVTFPEPFEDAPWCMVTSNQGTSLEWTATPTTLNITMWGGWPWQTYPLRWIAIGP